MPRLTYGSISDVVIDVCIGESEQTFSVRRKLLCSSSEYFQAKLKPEWSQPGAVVQVPYDSEQAFKIYNWLHTKPILAAAGFSENHYDNKVEWKTLAHAYALGDALIDIAFKDNIMDALGSKLRSASGDTFWKSAGEFIEIVYALPDSCPLQRFLLDIYKDVAGKERMVALIDEAPIEFFCDLAIAGKSESERPLDQFEIQTIGYEGCMLNSYHSHRDPELCYL